MNCTAILRQCVFTFAALLGFWLVAATAHVQADADYTNTTPVCDLSDIDPHFLAGLPSRVPGDQQLACNFQKFAWHSFLALVSKDNSHQSTLRFQTFMPSYGIFTGPGQSPTPYGDHPPDNCSESEQLTSVSTGSAPFLYSNLIKQAGSVEPLIDQGNQFVWYHLAVNKPAYTMLTQCELYKAQCAGQLKPKNTGVDVINNYPKLAFPTGSVEIKTSWKVLSAEEIAIGRFYTVEGRIKNPSAKAGCDTTSLGLVGMHIVSKTPKHPAFIWSTFEHRANAPLCTDLTAKPDSNGQWNFFNHASYSTCSPATDPRCNLNTYVPDKPAQVCRAHPLGDSLQGVFPNGQDCSQSPDQFICQPEARAILAESTASIQAANASAQALIKGASDRVNPVWANYELTGNLWIDNGQLPPQLHNQAGSLSAANTSMETFVQNGVARVTNPNNCFSCHNQATASFGKTLPPAGLSHIFDKIQPDTKGCASGVLPAACADHYK